MGVQVLINDPKNLEKIRHEECEILKKRVMMIINAGANVILTTKGMDDVANKYLCENNVFGLRRVDKQDLRRIAKASGASIVTTLASAEGEESFDPSLLGECKTVYEESLGDNDFVFFKDFKKF